MFGCCIQKTIKWSETLALLKIAEKLIKKKKKMTDALQLLCTIDNVGGSNFHRLVNIGSFSRLKNGYIIWFCCHNETVTMIGVL